MVLGLESHTDLVISILLLKKKGSFLISRDHVPLNKATTFARFRWNQMPFVFSPAPELFQLKIREMTYDLLGIGIMKDIIGHE